VARSVVQAHRKVGNATEDRGHRNTERQLRRNLGPEVGTHLVHVVVHFSQEDRTFVRENQDNVLNSIHGNVHRHEEEGALNVLENTSVVLADSVRAVRVGRSLGLGAAWFGVGASTVFVHKGFGTSLPEEEGHESRSYTGSRQFHIRSLGKSHDIEEVTGRKQFVLVEPGRLYLNGIVIIAQGLHLRMDFCSVTDQFT